MGRKTIRVVVLNVVILGGLVALLDPTVFRWIETHQTEAAPEEWYHTAVFRSEESMASQTRWRFANGYLFRDNLDRRGKYINVTDGRRRTTPQPAITRSRVFIFGGSTTFCGNVPDSLTWPSLLSRDLAPLGFEVVNLGVSGVGSVDRLRRLRSILNEIHSGDTVIFYFGVNDALRHRLETQPTGVLAEWPKLRRSLEILSRWSAGARLVLRWGRGTVAMANKLDADPVAETLSAMVRAKSLTVRRGARFIPILQPNALTSADSGQRLKNVTSALHHLVVNDVQTFYRRIREESPPQLGLVSAVSIFDDLPQSPYLDWNHVNELGNDAVADFVRSQLQR